MRIRAFVALNFSIAVTRRIAEEVAARRAGVEQAGLRVAWVSPANLHLTLKFLGSVPEESIEAAAGALRQRLSATGGGVRAPFEVTARGLGAFPSPERPRVLWVGADGGELLGRLVGDVERTLIELGFPKEDREFHPHITVGRVKEQGAGWDGARWAADGDGAVFGTSVVSEVVLYESKTLREGAEYHARARVPIGGKQ